MIGETGLSRKLTYLNYIRQPKDKGKKLLPKETGEKDS